MAKFYVRGDRRSISENCMPLGFENWRLIEAPRGSEAAIKWAELIAQETDLDIAADQLVVDVLVVPSDIFDAAERGQSLCDQISAAWALAEENAQRYSVTGEYQRVFFID